MSTTAQRSERVGAADHADRRLAEPATLAPLFLRVHPGHALPLVVETKHGHQIARFALPGDLAMFIGPDGKRSTLPAEILRQYEEQKAGL